MRSNPRMRCRRWAALTAPLLLVTATAQAVVPRTGPRLAAEELTAMPAALVARPLRTQPRLRWQAPAGPAWQAFTTAAGGRWRAALDPATGVPSRIWGSGIAAPGTVASAAAAEAFARTLLRTHLALLAPGAASTDFVLVANHTDGAIRSVGFAQQAGGRRVVGGQISFRFKRDRLIAIGSEALPRVEVAVPRARLARATLHTRATAALRHDLALPAAPVSAPGDEVVLPLVADDAVLGFRLARPVTIDGGAEGRYLAYADVATGGILAVRQLNTYATGTLRYRAVDRFPGRGRVDVAAPGTAVTVAGAPQTTTAEGGVTWAGDAATTVETTTRGDLVTIVNKESTEGPLATASLALTPGGVALWDATAAPLEDAQVNVFIHTQQVKAYVATNLDAAIPLLAEQMTANVNIGQECNAFFDGETINFFQASDRCQNTGLLQDVIFHEFGHALHTAEIVPGVGAFDGAMSEGASDFLAATITRDPGMGRGFFYSDLPLRDLDPADRENVWPQDIREIHYTGLIYGGTMWDLRKAMIAVHGEAEGIRLTSKIFLGTLRRATSIPTSLIEALVEDDDDGDLDNGTPNECVIRGAFGRHGLRTASGQVRAPGSLVSEQARSTLVRVELTGLSARCGTDDVEAVTVDWRPSGAAEPAAGSVPAARAVDGSYYVQLPLALEGKVLYRARVTFTDGSVLTLSDNLADPYYELYQGDTIPLYCTDFEGGDPFAEGWTTGSLDQTASPWAWGPAMPGGATDPAVAFSGTHLLAQALGGDYAPGTGSWVQMPTVDVGRWTDVRLQYRRWLAVEDSYFDQARVLVNGKQAWLNFTADVGDSSATHHIDREWRFHDVGLSGYTPGRELTVRWELTADQGLQLGGWQVDDVCIVANVNSVCGDGVKSVTEGCDSGVDNADAPNACRTYCLRPACGDGIVDDGEQCDVGPGGDGACSAACQDITLPELGGCCSADGGPGGSLALAGALGALLLRRRRR